jgi:hypothetical protein
MAYVRPPRHKKLNRKTLYIDGSPELLETFVDFCNRASPFGLTFGEGIETLLERAGVLSASQEEKCVSRGS